MICEDQPKLDIRKLWLQGFKSLRIDGITIPITTTQCHYGGERRWFMCPDCGRRCAVLYKPDYRCRLCRNGRYWVERFGPLDRRILRSKRLREKLGQYRPNLSMPVPFKPPRMHWRTYRKICAEIRALEAQILEEIWGDDLPTLAELRRVDPGTDH